MIAEMRSKIPKLYVNKHVNQKKMPRKQFNVQSKHFDKLKKKTEEL